MARMDVCMSDMLKLMVWPGKKWIPNSNMNRIKSYIRSLLAVMPRKARAFQLQKLQSIAVDYRKTWLCGCRNSPCERVKIKQVSKLSIIIRVKQIPTARRRDTPWADMPPSLSATATAWKKTGKGRDHSYLSAHRVVRDKDSCHWGRSVKEMNRCSVFSLDLAEKFRIYTRFRRIDSLNKRSGSGIILMTDCLYPSVSM